MILAGGCASPSSPAGEAASFEGGTVSIAEVEASLRARMTGEEKPLGSWADRYRKETEALAAEGIILGNRDDLEEALREELKGAFARLECEVISEVYLTDRAPTLTPPTEEEVQTFFDERPDLFDKQERRLTWHLYQRDGDDGPEGTRARLQSLRDRVHQGESFRKLAKEHSHSENRSLGGHLGWMERGDLPPNLEKVVFELPSDRVSEPQLSSGGGFLMYVSNILPAVKVGFPEAAPRIRRRLMEVEGRRFVGELAEEDEADESDLILGKEALAALFQQAPLDQEILRIEGAALTLGEFQEAIAAHGGKPVPMVTPGEEIIETYQDWVDRLSLCRLARKEGLSEDDRGRIEARAKRLGTSSLVDKRLKSRLAAKAESQPERLERFFADNRHLYQGPLRLQVEGLIAPKGESSLARARELEEVREDLSADRLDLAAAADRPWLNRFEATWLGPSALAGLEPKVLLYLVQLGGPGITPVFRQGGRLLLFRVLERQEPVPLDYAQVKQRVLTDFVARHQQELFQEVLSTLLEEAHFEYHESQIAAHLEAVTSRSQRTP